MSISTENYKYIYNGLFIIIGDVRGSGNYWGRLGQSKLGAYCTGGDLGTEWESAYPRCTLWSICVKLDLACCGAYTVWNIKIMTYVNLKIKQTQLS